MATAPHLYLDEDVSREIAARLRASGYDVETTRDANQLRNSDEAQLAFAAGSKRILITHNIRDFVLLANAWARTDRHHAGLILATLHEPATLAAAILALLELYPDAGEWVDLTVSTVT